MHQGPQIEGHAEPGRSPLDCIGDPLNFCLFALSSLRTASKFWHTRIDEDDVSPGGSTEALDSPSESAPLLLEPSHRPGVDEADIRKVRADLLRVQFGRLDTTKKGYLSSGLGWRAPRWGGGCGMQSDQSFNLDASMSMQLLEEDARHDSR